MSPHCSNQYSFKMTTHKDLALDKNRAIKKRKKKKVDLCHKCSQNLVYGENMLCILEYFFSTKINCALITPLPTADDLSGLQKNSTSMIFLCSVKMW